VYHHRIQPDDNLLVLSTDGIFLVHSQEQLADRLVEKRLIQGQNLTDISMGITDECCENYNCKDNISLVLVDLKQLYLE